MKTKRPQVKLDWKEIYALLIAYFRQLNKLSIGPLDRLQSQEYQFVVKNVSELLKSADLSTREHLSAFLLYQWPLYLSQGLSLMQEIPQVPNKVLEVGNGTGPFALAALMSGSSEAFCYDSEELSLKSAAHLAGRLGYPISIRITNPKAVSDWPSEGKFDLIIVSYSLLNFFHDPIKQKQFVTSLLQRVNSDGHLLLVDSSSKEINHQYLKLRDLLLAEQIKIQAPCIWQGPCPALAQGAAPCFTQRPLDKPFLINDIQKSLQIHSNSHKMTYLLLCPPNQKTTHPENKRLYRVISPPIETFKGKRHYLCGVDGKKTLGSRLTSYPKTLKAYEFLKRGDVVEINNPTELENDLILSEESQFFLAAPFDKPVK
ncbi:MAG: methyltransferase domain-containing protein [Chlamydiae bacterium]|nr:methyltransferase domain-containing protein [Chlamydiota bacterium]